MIDQIGRDNPNFLHFEKETTLTQEEGGDLTPGLVRENVTPNKITFYISM